MLPMSLLSVSDLHVGFGSTEILRGVSFELEPGETLGVVGESGCGKSMTGFAIMGMLQSPGKVTKGSIQLDGVELVGMKERDMRKIRGNVAVGLLGKQLAGSTRQSCRGVVYRIARRHCSGRAKYRRWFRKHVRAAGGLSCRLLGRQLLRSTRRRHDDRQPHATHLVNYQSRLSRTDT